MPTLEQVTAYLSKQTYSSEWNSFSTEEQEQALNTAYEQLYHEEDLGSLLEEAEWVKGLKEALFLQAFFVARNKDYVDYATAEGNGITSFDGISTSGVKSLYPPVLKIVKKIKLYDLIGGSAL